MKKLNTLTTALCLATAFCGFCTGCAANISEKVPESAPASVVASDTGSAHKIILNPGWYYSGSTKTNNTIASGATALSASEADAYRVANGYFSTVSVGSDLPTPTTTRSGMTFAGWRYANDGELVIVSKMPDPGQLADDMYLYAKWNGTGSASTGGGEVISTTVTVNGKTMSVNGGNTNTTVKTEYMLLGTSFENNVTLEFKMGDKAITVGKLDSASTGIALSGGKVTTTKAGSFTFYLKNKTDGSWELYASCTVDPSKVSKKGDTVTAGNTYLVGNIDDSDVSWNNWKQKGFKLTDGTLTIVLTKNDNVKFVKYNSATSQNWYNTIASGDATALHVDTTGDNNIIIDKTGTFVFTVTADGKISYTFTAAA